MIDRTTAEPTPPLVVQRPLGVWLLTLYDGLIAGALPTLTLAFVYLASALRSEVKDVLGGFSIPEMLFLLGLGAAIVGAAIGAWRGRRRARTALVVLVALHYGLVALNNLSLAAAGGSSGHDRALAVSRGLQAIVLIGLNTWYFLGPRPRAFYAAGTTVEQGG